MEKKKEIATINSKGEYHGYQERYDTIIRYRGVVKYRNRFLGHINIGYVEQHYKKITEYNIR